MRQKVRHAIIKEQGITFAVVSAKDHVVASPAEAKELIAQLVLIYGGPVILVGESNRRTIGRPDIVKFLHGIEPSRLPWRDQYIELPSGVSGGGIGSRQPESANWTGRSGASYTYQVQPLDDTSPPDVDGNYIFAKANAGGWTPLYIGQGRLADRVGPAHDKWD